MDQTVIAEESGQIGIRSGRSRKKGDRQCS